MVKNNSIVWTDLGNGVRRRVLAHNADTMIVEVEFEEGGIGAAHSHPHVQCTYVLSGMFAFSTDTETVEVHAGDTLAFDRNETHGCVCKAAGSLIDVFSPMREDFLG